MKNIIEFKIKEYKDIKTTIPQINLTFLDQNESILQPTPENIKHYNRIVSELFENSRYIKNNDRVIGINNIIVINNIGIDLSNIFKETSEFITQLSGIYGSNEYTVGNLKQDTYFCTELETRSDVDDLTEYLDYTYKDLDYTIYTTLEYTTEEKVLKELEIFNYKK